MDIKSQIRHLHGPEEVTYAPDELVVVCPVRDGRPYLKSFIEHYFTLGVKHIVFLDNGSTDGTDSVARSYENVTILQTERSHDPHQIFMKQYLVNRFGRDRWILCVDIDELFDYPYSDMVDLSSFLKYLTEKSYTAVVAQMLDMFPDKPLLGRLVPLARPLKDLYMFYDISSISRQSYYSRDKSARNIVASEEIEIYRGGLDETIFGNDALLTKHPLMYIDEDIRPVAGPHWVGGARLADITCVLLHYKFADALYSKAVRDGKRETYFQDSRKYERFLQTLEQNPELQIKRETAQELESINDLVDNQFLVISADYMAWVYSEQRKSASANVGQGDNPPRWLIEAFSKISARARIQGRVTKVLKLQVERLERNLATERQKAKDSAKNSRAEERWKAMSDELKKRRRKIKEINARFRQTNRRLQVANSKVRRLRREKGEMESTRVWRIAHAINVFNLKIRNTLSRGG